MDYKLLCRKKEQLKQLYEQLPKEVLQRFDKSFEIEYTHNSTAIEGNTLSLIQTKAVLEDGISVGGKTLREIYEVVNHDKSFGFIKKCIAEGKTLDEKIVKDIHALLMDNIITGGIYRNVEVRITGAKHKPPVPNEMYQQIKRYAIQGKWKRYRTCCMDSCRVCKNPSLRRWQRKNITYDYELSVDGIRFPSGIHSQRKPLGIFRSVGSLRSRWKS